MSSYSPENPARMDVSRIWPALLWGTVISAAGDLVFDVTMTIWIASDLSRGQSWGPAAVGGVLIAAAVPVVAVGPFAGVLVDRAEKTLVVRWGCLIQAACSAILAGAALFERSIGTKSMILMILGCVFLSNVAARFTGPAQLGLVAVAVPEAKRTAALATRGSIMALAALIAAPLAAVMFSAFGAVSAMSLNCLSFLLCAGLCGYLPSTLGSLQDGSDEPEADSGTYLNAFRNALSTFLQDPRLRALAHTLTVISAAGGIVATLDTFFILNVLHSSVTVIGLLGLAYAGGMIVGNYTLRWVGARWSLSRLFCLGAASGGMLLIIYSRTTDATVAAPILCTSGIGMGLANGAFTPLLMKVAPSGQLGALSNFLTIGPTLAELLGSAVAGWLPSTIFRGVSFNFGLFHFGPIDTTLTLAGALLCTSGLFGFLSLRDLQSNERPEVR